MRITTLVALLALAIAHTATAQIPTLVPHVQMTLVGFSTATTQGDAGVLGMTALCHADFAGSRMCTSEEVLNSEAIYPISTTEAAWVRPVYQPFVASSADYATLDASGNFKEIPSGSTFKSRLSNTCAGWTTVEIYDTGATVTPGGGFGEAACYELHPVACCKLIEVPEPSSSLSIGAGVIGLAAASMSKRAVWGSCEEQPQG